MIFLLSKKMWEKQKKKLVEPKDYIVIDSLDEDESSLSDYTNVVTVDNLALPSKLLHVFEDDFEDILDANTIKELQEQFFKGKRFRTGVVAVTRTYVESDVNIFIVIRNQAYKSWRKIYEKAFLAVIPELRDFLWILSKDLTKEEKAALSRDGSPDKLKKLESRVLEKEKEMETDFKKKSKKSKKKRKKSKKNGFGFEDIDFD